MRAVDQKPDNHLELPYDLIICKRELGWFLLGQSQLRMQNARNIISSANLHKNITLLLSSRYLGKYTMNPSGIIWFIFTTSTHNSWLIG